MDALSDSLLDSGYDDDYYWTRQRMPQDTSLDALRRALLQALMDQELLSQRQIQQMLDENEGKYEGSQLQEMLNQLIERLVEEGYLNLQEEPVTPEDTHGAIMLARKMFAPSESGDAFQKRYFDAIQRDPKVVMEHAELARLFAKEPSDTSPT